MARRWYIALPILAIASGCNTNIRILELRRDQLLRIERGTSEVASSGEAGIFQPELYDLYLLLNGAVFDRILSSFDGMAFVVDADGRPIEFHLGSVRTAFRSGYSTLRVSAAARDRRSGLQTEVMLDASLLVEGERSRPGEMYLRLVATRIVPRLSWGPFELTKWRFARRLAELQAIRLTERIPHIQIPLRSAFSVGGAAASRPVRIPTGAGSITGNLAVPATSAGGSIVVRHVLFLRNGVHVFADVEGL